MKKIIISLLTVLIFGTLAAQTAPGCFPYPKTISVTGSAEMNIIPDEIYVQVDLREYKKKGEDKKEIDVIKAYFLAKCKLVGIADSNIAVASYDGYNISSIWRRRKKGPDMFAGISYQIKFHNTKMIDDLVNNLDDEATANFAITRTSHSKIIEFRKQLKIQAVKAAKEKAQYLAESVNEQVGPAITIKEPDESQNSDVRVNKNTYSIANSSIGYSKGDANGGDDGVDYRKIKLRFEVTVLYALK